MGERRGTGIGILTDARGDRHEYASPIEEEVAGIVAMDGSGDSNGNEKGNWDRRALG